MMFVFSKVLNYHARLGFADFHKNWRKPVLTLLTVEK